MMGACVGYLVGLSLTPDLPAEGRRPRLPFDESTRTLADQE
jgi:hypothetical protein